MKRTSTSLLFGMSGLAFYLALVRLFIAKVETAPNAASLLTTTTKSKALLLPASCTDPIIFVNDDAVDYNDGTSWANAYTSLQAALDVACSCVDKPEIWVAAGTYLPTAQVDVNENTILDAREQTFRICSNVRVYGGFASDENLLSDRDITANVTILSGDIGTPNVNTDNAHHVVYFKDASANTRLDGFTITRGNANGSGNFHERGGAVFNTSTAGANVATSSPVIANCVITGHNATRGGAIAEWGNTGRKVAATFLNCKVTNNTAGNSGSAMITDANGNGFVETKIINCVFSGNRNTSFFGAIAANYSSNLTITNSTFSGNSSGSDGGALAAGNGNSTITLVNSIIWNNQQTA